MRRKLLFAACIMSLSVSAQDTIKVYEKMETVGKVVEVSPTEIRYYKSNMTDGPVFKEPIENVEYIKYSNGEKVIYVKDKANLEQNEELLKVEKKKAKGIRAIKWATISVAVISALHLIVEILKA